MHSTATAVAFRLLLLPLRGWRRLAAREDYDSLSCGKLVDPMLQNFFRLDDQFAEFGEVELENHFRHSNDLRDVLFDPEQWPNSLRSLKSLNFRNVSLSKTNFKKVTFTECTFKDCLFVGATFQEVEFHRCKFIDCNFYKADFSQTYIDPSSFAFDSSYRKTHTNICVGLYQRLAENSSKEKQNDFEREADIEFRRWKRWQLRYDRAVGKITKTEIIYKWASNWLYENIAGYGYKPLRFVLATLLFFGAASVLNMNIMAGEVSVDGEKIVEISLSDSIFYTYSMMTALGFSSMQV